MYVCIEGELKDEQENFGGDGHYLDVNNVLINTCEHPITTYVTLHPNHYCHRS